MRKLQFLYRFCLFVLVLSLLSGCGRDIPTSVTDQTVAPISSATPAPIFTPTASWPAGEQWKLRDAPLSTSWAADVDPQNVLPEYPRPQMVRENWQNLNGEWEFEAAAPGSPPPSGRSLIGRILVPFPVESSLSGVMENGLENMWYRRSFEVPQEWTRDSGRVLLQFGAVDWRAEVYVNGELAGTHTGGYDAFSIDVTLWLRTGQNELVVGVYDPTDRGDGVIGKQRIKPKDIWYTACSGIWQTVWLEPVPALSIERLEMVPDVPGESLRLTVATSGADAATGMELEAVVMDAAGKEIGRSTGPANAEIRIPVPQARLWWPDDPYLYNLVVRLSVNNETVDHVTGYFGMRSIEIDLVDGVARPLLNGQFLFQIGLLDQGYWPDGIYTAPTDAALRFDIEQAKLYGYILLRKHMKVEPQRWYYWADKLGILVWQDMPAMLDTLSNPSSQAREQYELELQEMVDEHISSPSIILWVDFNEGWAEYDAARIAGQVHAWDPSRLVNNASGWTDSGAGDVIDIHNYEGPSAPPQEQGRISVLGEFGGLGLRTPHHTWLPSGFAYKRFSSVEELTAAYLSQLELIGILRDSQGLSAAVYTQLTDVEGEINGLFTYDRAVPKLDPAVLKPIHDKLVNWQ